MHKGLSLIVAPFEKVKKRGIEKCLYCFRFTLVKCFFLLLFFHLLAFYDFKVPVEHSLFKNGQSHDVKYYFVFSMNRYDSSYNVDLSRMVSNYKSLLITTSEKVYSVHDIGYHGLPYIENRQHYTYALKHHKSVKALKKYFCSILIPKSYVRPHDFYNC